MQSSNEVPDEMDEPDYNYHVASLASKSLTKERQESEDNDGSVDEDAVVDAVKQHVESSRIPETEPTNVLAHSDHEPADPPDDKEETAFQAMVNDVCWRIRAQTDTNVALPFR